MLFRSKNLQNFFLCTSPDALQWNFGGFAKYMASQHLNFRVSVGYTVYSPDKTGTSAQLQDSSLIYVDLVLSHRLNQYVTYSLTAGRGVNLSFFGQTYENYYANLNATWYVLREITVTTPFSWTRGTALYGNSAPFDQYQAGISFGRKLAEKLTGSIGYRLVVRDSGSNSGDYVANFVSLSFSYQF